MHRSFALAVVLGVAVLFTVTGCIKSRMLVVVKPDGSGHLVLTQLSSDQFGSFSRGRGDDLDGKLQRLAEQFGDGVTVAKVEPVKGKGFAAVFAFTNVNDVSVPIMALGPVSDMDGDDMMGAPPFVRQRIAFTFTRGDASRLSIVMPAALAEAVAKPVETNESAAADSTMSDMEEMAGAEIDVSVQITGQVLKQNASYPNVERKDRFTLFHVEGDKLAENPAALRMMGGEPHDMDDMDDYFARLLHLCGATVETNRQVTIDFK